MCGPFLSGKMQQLKSKRYRKPVLLSAQGNSLCGCSLVTAVARCVGVCCLMQLPVILAPKGTNTPFQLGLRSLDCFLKCLKEHFQNYQRNLIIYLCLILWELARGLQTQVLWCKRLLVCSLLSAAAWLTEKTMWGCVLRVGVALCLANQSI